jgi:hypothetical protein
VSSTSARCTAQVDSSTTVGSGMRGSSAQCVSAVQNSARQSAVKSGEADRSVMRRRHVADTVTGTRLLLASSGDVGVS